MRILECNLKVTGNGYKALDGRKAVSGYKAKIDVKAEN